MLLLPDLKTYFKQGFDRSLLTNNSNKAETVACIPIRADVIYFFIVPENIGVYATHA